MASLACRSTARPVSLPIFTRVCIRSSAAVPPLTVRALHNSSCLLARQVSRARALGRKDEVISNAATDASASEETLSGVDEAAPDDSDAGSEKKLTGAYYDKRLHNWRAAIRIAGTKVDLGRYQTEKEAHEAYLKAKTFYRGTSAKEKAAASKAADDGASKSGSSRRRSGRVRGVAAGDEEAGRKVLITREQAEKLGIQIIDLDSDSEDEDGAVGSGSGGAVAGMRGADRGEAGGAGVIGSSTAEHGPDGSSSPARKPKASKAAKPSPTKLKPSKYVGVLASDAPGLALWEAVYTLPDGKEISGGEYESEEDAAKAYDALARMYGGSGAQTNFPLDPYSAWVPPEEVVATGQIETKPGLPLTVEEITSALNQERGLDVRVVDLAGKSDLADALIFATGRSVPHMRKMADCIARALRKRRIPGLEDPGVENREGDDWMVVDCGNIIVNIMDAESREVFDLEAFYSNMKLGEDPYAGLSYEEWLEKNPVPDKWLRRLERDEQELQARARLTGAPRLGAGAGAPGPFGKGGRAASAAGPDRRVSAYHFPAKLKGKPKT